MKIRIHTLWRVPVWCAAAGILCYLLTVYLAGLLFVTRTVEADGSVGMATDPLRALAVHGVLFAAVLLAGGLWAFRSMTKGEIAGSAAIAAVLGIGLTLLCQAVPATAAVLAPVMEWSSELSSIFSRLTGENPPWLIWLCRFAPFLFVPFGKSART